MTRGERDWLLRLVASGEMTPEVASGAFEAEEGAGFSLADVLREGGFTSGSRSPQDVPEDEGTRTLERPHEASVVDEARRAGAPILDARLSEAVQAHVQSGPERYASRGVLGRGGMGEVSEWFDADLLRPLAAKRLLGQASPQALARFVAEAQVTAQLSHPNIVPIYDIGTTPAGDLYYTMKRVEGRDLQSIVFGIERRDPAVLAANPLPSLVDAFHAACRAVAFAHARGVVHRDLKPANIMVGELGEVFVVDWGLARIDRMGAVTDLYRELGVEPAGGSGAGTLRFMAPEQVEGGPVSKATDVHALGAILYALLTGTPPFTEEAAPTLALAVSERRPEPPSVRAPDLEIPRALEAIALKCLEKRSSDRYPDAGVLLEDLDRYRAGLAVTAHPEPPTAKVIRWVRRNRAKAVAILTAALALVAGVGLMRLWGEREKRNLAARAVATADGYSREALETVDPAWRLRLLLAELARLDEAQQHLPSDAPLRIRRARLADRIGDMALDSADYTLAAYLFERSGELHFGPAHVQSKLATLERKRNENEAADRSRLSELLALVAGGSVPVEDAVYEVVAMKGPHATDALLQHLAPGGPEHVLAFVVRSLGRLGHPEAVSPLVAILEGGGLDVLAQIEVIRALGRIGDPRAEPAVRRVRRGAGSISYLWSQTVEAHSRLLEAADLEASAAIGPDEVDVREAFQRALDCEAKADWDEALRIYSSIIEVYPDAAAYSNRGRLLRQKGRLEEAVRDYDEAIRLDGENIHAYNNRGVALVDLGRFEEALRDYTRVTELAPGVVAPYGNRANLLKRMGRSREALADYAKALEVDPRHIDTWYNRARIWLDLGDLERALADYESALELDPRYARAHVGRGEILARRGELDAALAAYGRAIEIDPRWPTPYYERAKLYARRGDKEGALADYSRVIERKADHVNAWHDRGSLYLELGRPDEAIRDFTRVLELDPGDATAFNNRGAAWRSKKAWDRAIEDYSSALGIDPLMAAAWRNRGVARYYAGLLREAADDLEECLRLEPTHPEGSEFRKIIEGALGRPSRY